MVRRSVRWLQLFPATSAVLAPLLLTALSGPLGAIFGATVLVVVTIVLALTSGSENPSIAKQEPSEASAILHAPAPYRRIANVTRLAVLSLLVGLALVIYLRHIGSNPAGLFCDEAAVGLQSYRLLRGEADLESIPIFVRNFEYVHVGILPLLAAAPFVTVFGLDAFGIRLTSAVLTLATLVVFYFTLRWLKIPFASVAVALFGFTPIVIHVGRLNLGHAPSVFLLAVGFYLYVQARMKRSICLAIWAGACFGLSPYSNGPFYVFTPMVVGAIGLSELCFNGRRVKEWSVYAITSGVTLLWFVPIGYKALADPSFFHRLHDKQQSQLDLLSLGRIQEMLVNYPKYFSLDFLFRIGEVGLPGGWISRHSVAGAGVLSWAALPVFAIALYAVVHCWRHPTMRFLLPWVVIAITYPLPDLLTTSRDRPPYTFAIVGASIAIPFLCGLAFLGLQSASSGGWTTNRVRRRDQPAADGKKPRPRVLLCWADQPLVLAATASLLLFSIVFSGLRFYTGPYERYPLISADYWGWQYGPKEMIAYYKANWLAYDEFIMDGNYNGAYIFLDLYLTNPNERRKASLGDLDRLDPAKKQLFGVRAEVWNKMSDIAKSGFRLDKVIFYPNGEAAAYLLELK